MSSSVIIGLRLDLSRTDLSNSESYILKLNSALCWCAGGINSESVCMNPFFTNRAGSSIVMELSKYLLIRIVALSPKFSNQYGRG